ncbi:unnamed protein product [Malus baccata var. baccata]
MMGDPLGSSRVSSQKQNCEGVFLKPHAKNSLQSSILITLSLFGDNCEKNMSPFGRSLTLGSIGTLKLSEFAREQSYDG